MAEETVTHDEHEPQTDAPAKPVAGHHFHDDNKTVIMGREIPFPIYTVVYGALALLTVIEVLLSQLPRGFLTIPIMLVIAFLKAGLVVWFYMHLNTDSRIFAITLIAPVVMVIIATLFLMIVPTGY
jgi:cytochrome c oxidase subunit IV